jgi:phenylacetate-CoA ligase
VRPLAEPGGAPAPDAASDVYARLFAAAVFPLLDRLNGTRIAAILARLLAGERLDPAEIERRQEEKLARALERARRESVFYRRLWSSGGRGPASVHPLLDGLPIITRADLAAATARGELPLAGHRGSAIAARTSGSTGSPMTFYRSPAQESWFWALRFRIWHWAGYRPGDPYLTINLNPRAQWRKRLQDRLFRCSYLTFNADNQDSRRIVERLRRRPVRHLNGFSSSLYVLAEHMLAGGIENPGVRGVTSTGDTLHPLYRQAVESAFGVRVLDYYGAGGEGFHLASQCRESGERYHVHPENAVLEILGDDGPAPPGAPGRVVVTQLDNDAMPLLRYDLEDVAVAAPAGARCPCGRTLPLLARVEGRAADLVWTGDGAALVPHFFVVLFKNLQQVHRYQVVQERAESIRVRLVARPGADRRAVERTVRQAVAAASRGALATELEWVDEIPLSGAGKRRLVISAVGRQRPAAPAGGARAESRP